MATFLSDQMTLLAAVPRSMVKSNEFGGRTRRAWFSITLPASGLATGDNITLCEIPAGARITGGNFRWGTAQGVTATTAIGIAGTTGKYFVAAVTNDLLVKQVADTIAHNYGVALTARETIIATNAAAAWAASSVLKGHIEYTVD